MNAKDAIKLSFDMERMVSLGYLQDLTDAEMMHRPCAGANHIKWQLGHIIAAENHLINAVAPNSMPPLPAGFAEKYSKETAGVDDSTAFDSKETLVAEAARQRAGTIQALESLPEDRLTQDSGVPYAATVAGIFSLQGSHWLMHAGQWAVIRRQLGRPPLF